MFSLPPVLWITKRLTILHENNSHFELFFTVITSFVSICILVVIFVFSVLIPQLQGLLPQDECDPMSLYITFHRKYLRTFNSLNFIQGMEYLPASTVIRFQVMFTVEYTREVYRESGRKTTLAKLWQTLDRRVTNVVWDHVPKPDVLHFRKGNLAFVIPYLPNFCKWAR